MTPLPKSKSLVVADEHQQQNARQRQQRQTLARKSSGILNRILAGFVLVGLLIGGLGGWSATAELSGAVIAPGQLVVDGSAKKIQHATGGVIGDIRVKNGDRVSAGDVLLTLDETQAGAQLAILDNKILRLTSEKHRLEAERDGKAMLRLADGFDTRDPKVKAAFSGEENLLKARMTGWRTQKLRLSERIQQIRKEIEAITAQRKAKEREIALIKRELGMVEELREKKLTNLPRLIEVQREVARFEGEHGALQAQIARSESHIAEIELQMAELDQRILTEAHTEIRNVDAQIGELDERRLAAADQVRRTELRSPVAGIVHDLSVHTIGGVIRPGETAMMIVPSEDALLVEARLAPGDIDQVVVGQPARLRFTALNQKATPELTGTVIHVGADLTRDPTTGREHFTARITLDEGQSAKFNGVKLVAGMPVEGFIATGQRTALSYLLKPLSDQIERALRE